MVTTSYQPMIVVIADHMSGNCRHCPTVTVLRNFTGDFQDGLGLELSVRGPQGWNVEPNSVSVKYNREGLKGCEKDVNFAFTGFQVLRLRI